MASSGYKTGDLYGIKKPKSPTTQFGNPNTFTVAADRQAQDYDTIMKNYSDLYAGARANPNQGFSNVNPRTTNYSRSSEVDASLGNLGELSRTGGYSEEGIADLRSRGVSPIRSIYANAQRGLDRSRALSGGYSPNYAAASGKMAREMSDKIGQTVTDVNAGIAQNVASNRINIAPQFGSLAQRENEARTGNDRANADSINRASEFNATMGMQNRRNNQSDALGAVEGMRGLYGTTPALTKLFGDQVGQAAGINQNQQQIDQKRRTDMLNVLGRKGRA